MMTSNTAQSAPLAQKLGEYILENGGEHPFSQDHKIVVLGWSSGSTEEEHCLRAVLQDDGTYLLERYVYVSRPANCAGEYGLEAIGRVKEWKLEALIEPLKA